MLFSEPKIPQWFPIRRVSGCSALFQCSSASRKFLNVISRPYSRCNQSVSVLFSEPKIPQSGARCATGDCCSRFSALQRAENSSIITSRILPPARSTYVSVLFSEPKIPQSPVICSGFAVIAPRFSALQRAENSSIVASNPQAQRRPAFQCSSASRKFLNLE